MYYPTQDSVDTLTSKKNYASHFSSLLLCSHLCFPLHQMAFLIQERKACQPLTHFKPDCVKEWEEWMGAVKKKNTRRDSRCVRAGKKKYIRKGGVWAAEGCGWGFLERCNPGCLFYDTRAPGVECGINMVISPKAIVLKSGGHLLYMQPWAWVSRLEIPLWKWLGGWLSGGKANGSQASLKSHFQLTKRIVLGGGRLKKGLLMGKKTRECTHTHTHTHTHTLTHSHTHYWA